MQCSEQRHQTGGPQAGPRRLSERDGSLQTGAAPIVTVAVTADGGVLRGDWYFSSLIAKTVSAEIADNEQRKLSNPVQ